MDDIKKMLKELDKLSRSIENELKVVYICKYEYEDRNEKLVSLVRFNVRGMNYIGKAYSGAKEFCEVRRYEEEKPFGVGGLAPEEALLKQFVLPPTGKLNEVDEIVTVALAVEDAFNGWKYDGLWGWGPWDVIAEWTEEYGTEDIPDEKTAWLILDGIQGFNTSDPSKSIQEAIKEYRNEQGK